MSELLKVLLKEQSKVTGNFIVSRNEIIEQQSDGKKNKVVVFKLFNLVPIYRSIRIVQ